MLEELKRDLGANLKAGDETVLTDIITHMTAIASNVSNRLTTDTKLSPYIRTAVKSAYLRRGDEGKTSSSEGSLASSYEDIEKKLRKDIISSGLRKIK